MEINSIIFWAFFVVVFIVYYLPITRTNKKYQNIWLLLCSYYFYGCANIKMIPILICATLVFYVLGIYIKEMMNQKRDRAASFLTAFGVILGLMILFYFKYLNFFAEELAGLLKIMGLNVTWTTLHIVLPVGVSFFVFKMISYVVEIHRESIDSCKDISEFSTYIAFFPTIMSGPIDRPNTFLPQLKKVHKFDYALAVDGCRQILWGMFIKMCIADHFAEMTHKVWENFDSMNGFSLIVASMIYYIELYADFSGYSHMAIGVGKLLGFRITRNFNHPLLARDVSEYWRRWHMSLTKWITDYVFMPLNMLFRKLGKTGVILATFINLIAIGMWHDANWKYVVFGLYYGLLFIPLILMHDRWNKGEIEANKFGLPKIKDLFGMGVTFILVSLGLIMFKAPDTSTGIAYIEQMVSNVTSLDPNLGMTPTPYIFTLIMLLAEWFQRNKEHELQFEGRGVLKKRSVRWSIYIVLILSIFMFSGTEARFIYFQF